MSNTAARYVIADDDSPEQTIKVLRNREQAYADALHSLIGVVASVKQALQNATNSGDLDLDQLRALVEDNLADARQQTGFHTRDAKLWRTTRFRARTAHGPTTYADAAECPRCGGVDALASDEPPTLGLLTALAEHHTCRPPGA